MRIFVWVVLILLVSCVSHDLQRIDCTLDGPSVQLVSITNATDCASGDGSVTTLVEGGKPPYTFFIDDVESPSAIFSDVSVGIHFIRIQDANGCEDTLNNVKVGALNFSFTATVVKDSLCLNNSGSIQVDVADGSPPFQYSINNGPFGDVNLFEELAAGNHLVKVVDSDDCGIDLNITVPRGNTGTSWLTDIRPLMVTYCALSGCHNGVSRTDLRIYENAKTHASEIKQFTQDRSMPFEGTPLTQSQINTIACWVDDGAPDN